MTQAVDECLARAPEGHRMALKQLRDAVMSVVPDADEVIRSGVPAFRYHGKPLVSIGAARRHVSFYVMNGVVLKAHTAELGVRHLEHRRSLRSQLADAGSSRHAAGEGARAEIDGARRE